MEAIRIKKSGFEDAFFVIVILLTVSIFILILGKAWTEIKTPLDEGLTSSMPSDSSVNVSTTLNKISQTTFMFDKLMPFLLIGLFAFVLIGAAIYMQHPIMAFVGIIILAVAILLGAIYANLYQSISEETEFSSTNAQLPIMSKLMQYLPFIILIIFVMIIVAVVYSRGGGGGLG